MRFIVYSKYDPNTPFQVSRFLDIGQCFQENTDTVTPKVFSVIWSIQFSLCSGAISKFLKDMPVLHIIISLKLTNKLGVPEFSEVIYIHCCVRT